MTDNPEHQQLVKKIASLFDLVADVYDNPSQRFFSFCADKLVHKIQPHQGHKLLDIATGTGAVAIPAAQAVGLSGRVHAIDLSANMLEQAENNIKKMQLPNIDLHEMNAQKLEFRGQYFDVITCSFGLFFLPDMLAGLKEWLRVLKPGGKLMFSSFAPNAFTPLNEVFIEHLNRFDVNTEMLRWQKLSDNDECIALLEKAGFINNQVDTEQMGYYLSDINDWWEINQSTGYRAFIEQVPVQYLSEFRNSYMKEIEQHMTDKGLWLDIETHFCSGNRPE